ncbi:hypothetical protein Hte_005249 [Hypoxylon texense]
MTIDGKTFGITQDFVTARSTYFEDVFETSDSCEFPFGDAVKWPTVVAYLTLLTLFHVGPTLHDPPLRGRALPPPAPTSSSDLDDPAKGPIILARTACYFSFVPFGTCELRLERLRAVTRIEEQGLADAAGFPPRDFHELVKLYHLCHLAGSPAAASEVERIFLRCLERLTTTDDAGEEMLYRVSHCQAEWLLLGNLRVSRSVKDMYLSRFGKEEQQEILERWNAIRYDVSPM